MMKLSRMSASNAANTSHAVKRTGNSTVGPLSNGIGGGVAWISLAETFPTSGYLHHALLFATPFITLACSAFYFLAKQQLEKWQFEKSLRQAIGTVERELSNPN